MVDKIPRQNRNPGIWFPHRNRKYRVSGDFSQSEKSASKRWNRHCSPACSDPACDPDSSVLDVWHIGQKVRICSQKWTRDDPGNSNCFSMAPCICSKIGYFGVRYAGRWWTPKSKEWTSGARPFPSGLENYCRFASFGGWIIHSNPYIHVYPIFPSPCAGGFITTDG